MLERLMEDLIAAFPDEFFSTHGFSLRGRQQSFAGIGRFDLLFVDRFATNVLMELKAVTAKYENATQLAKYKDALGAKGDLNILMWLVAPNIPYAVREFLDRIGIEYSEIHEAQFRRVAANHGIAFDVPAPTIPPTAKPPRSRPSRIEGTPVPETGDYAVLPDVDKQELAGLIEEFEAAAKRRIDKSLATNLRREVLDSEGLQPSRSTILQLARWCNTNNQLYCDGMAVAKKISVVLFGQVLDRERLGT